MTRFKRGAIVMLALFLNDSDHRSVRGGISVAKRHELTLEVAQHDAFYRHGRRRNRCRSQGARRNPEKPATDSAKVKAATPPNSATLHFRPEDRTVSLLVRPEFGELAEKPGCPPPRRERLAAIDVDGALFSRVIDL